MNGVVALGDRALLRVMHEYHQSAPSAIYVLGERESRDVLLHSLEDLVEPFMDAYFKGEAALRTSAALVALRARPDAYGELEFAPLAFAAQTVLQRALAPWLALIEMLDRANDLHPIELVVVSDVTVQLQAVAVAWAKARGVPSVFFASPNVREPADAPLTDRVIAFGPRSYRAYADLGVDRAHLEQQTHPVSTTCAAIAPNRSAYIERARTVQRWQATDVLVAFEPEPVNAAGTATAFAAFDQSVDAIFAAAAFARERCPALRIAVIPSRPVPDGIARVTAIASRHGVAAHEFIYSELEGDIWTAIADIVVSRESMRSLEAACAGIPAINVWQPANWESGPVFAAEDGIIDTASDALGPTLVALASNSAICAQIAAVARERAEQFGVLAPPALSGAAAVRAAQSLLSYRAVRAPAVHLKEQLDILIFSPEYTHASAGIRALYRLCHFVNTLGGKATMFPSRTVHPTWNTPLRTKNITDKTIVVYPETALAPLPAARVVRWVLNVPGKLSGATRYDDSEMVFYHPGFGEAAQSATAEILTAERELGLTTIDPELFYTDRSQPKLYDCVYVGKGHDLYARFKPPEIERAHVIRRGEFAWPASRAETAAMLRGCRTLYLYDAHSAISEEAYLCGTRVMLVDEDCTIREIFVEPPFPNDHLANVRAYYDDSQVARFLRAVEQRWNG